ncbi:aldehyde dehydrogenase [Comamonas serinivorans]|uniref:4-(hydroxymethyl)benzenesulfonate dehydrogenase n=1 Tax=Comamonas serinivorans TaxID=1082851 RepID=A0A1Y0EMG9_9BURK|nr:aldehyde dehydrogenase family protein [Comamonas serinivorans]ARU04651.1 aldehyde dehydrogenase [Comamonas serinivorans]
MSSTAPFQMLIDGQLVSGTASLPVTNPATAQVFAHAPDCTREQLDQAVSAARRAFPAWRDLGEDQRRERLAQMAPRIEQAIGTLAPLLTQEQGKPLASAQGEIGALVHFMREQSQLKMPAPVVNEDSPQRLSVTHRVPLGVVGALAPWNFPVLLAWWKVIPPLLAGNTMVLKPSPLTPLTALRVAELVADLLPPGVLNVISGGDELGPWLTAHDGIDKVSFTGSTQTGRRVMESASRTLKRLTLELGGNDAGIVLPDADVPSLIPQLFWSAFTNSGQVCIDTKRLYVHSSRFEEVVQGLADYARNIPVGPGDDPKTLLGPIQNERQFRRVQGLVNQAREQGLDIRFEGQVPEGPGYFVPVTLIANPPEDSAVVAEEAFGPVLPILSYDSIDEVVERANASPYGLGGTVWGKDEALATSVANRIQSGTVWVNETMHLSPHAAFSGHRQSGLGVEHGVEGLLGNTSAHTVVLKRQA